MTADASGLPFGLLGGLGPGSIIADYQIEDRLGMGGMAVVFRARDLRLGRLVALKVLAPALAADEEFRTRFIREWRAATAVEHPHIIPVYAADEAGDVLYIAMRLVSGGDLRTLVRREGPLDPWRTAGLVSAVAAALDAAHAVGLVHRDVKPGNILIDSVAGLADHVYLSDFGLSKGMMSSAGLTGTGQFLGTPDFAAPEQITGRRTDGHTDQYALGCVAFTLLTARPVFPRDDPMAVMFAHVQDLPPSAAALRPDLPAAVDQVLTRALAKSPDDRFATCGEFATALRAAMGAAPGTGDHRQTDASQPTTESPPERSATASSAMPDHPSQAATVLRADVASRARHSPAERGSRRAERGSRRTFIAAAAALTLVAAGATTAYVVTSDNGPGAGHPPAVGAGSSTAATSPRASASPSTPSSPPGPVPTELNSTAEDAGFELAFRGDNYLVSVTPGSGNAVTGVVSSWNLDSPKAAPAQFSIPDGDNALSPGGAMAYGGDVSTDAVPNYVWDTASGRKIATLPLSLKGAGPISDTGVLALTGLTGVTLWSARSGTVTGFLPYPAASGADSYSTIAISPDGSAVALTANAGKTYVLDTRSGAVTATLTEPTPPSPGDPSEFSANGSALAVAASSTTYIWSLSDRSHPVRTLPGFLAFSANGKLAAVSVGATVQLVNIASGKTVRTLVDPNLTNPASIGAFSSDDTELAVGDGSTDYVWNLSS